MIYLLVKMMTLLLIAAGLGCALGWFGRGARDREAREAQEGRDAARLHDLRAQRDAAEAALAEKDARIAELEAGASKPPPEPAAPPEAEAAAPVAAVTAAEEVETPDAPEPKSPPPAEPGPALSREVEAAAPVQAVTPAAAGFEPMARPADGGDDLRQISGVGPKIESLLHEAGVWSYSQIAAFTPEDVAAFDDRLKFRGRIEREDWIGQAKALAAGGKD